MKNLKKIISTLTSAALLAGLAIHFNACTEKSPMSSQDNQAAETQGLKILKIGDGVTRLNKIVTASRYVTRKGGGELIIDYKGYEHNNGNVNVKITLKVFKGSISQDAELMMSLDDQELLGNVDVTFSPHGITFSRPARLDIEAKNLDLSGVNPDDINIYYDNPETGQWEVMQSYAVIVNEANGYIKVIDAKLPHFSRYAMMAE